MANMRKKLLVLFLLFGCSPVIFAQTSRKSVSQVNFANFKSDGCSMFPDGNYRQCCVEHDLRYFQGGSWLERRRADNKLFSCVAAQKKFYNKLVAPMMWLGVRVGGVGFLPTSFRWGFGRKKVKVENAGNESLPKISQDSRLKN